MGNYIFTALSHLTDGESELRGKVQRLPQIHPDCGTFLSPLHLSSSGLGPVRPSRTFGGEMVGDS